MKRTVTARILSSLPVVRDRTNPHTGVPRRYDAEVCRRAEAALARMRERGIPASPSVQARDYAPAYKRSLPERSDPRTRADAVLGPGTAARAEEALRLARVNPWESSQRGRSR